MPGKPKARRHADDFYRTPPSLTRAFLTAWQPKGYEPQLILEPAAGDGAMIDPLLERFPGSTLHAYDLTPRGDDKRVQQRAMFLDTDEKYDLIFTNPPFNQALLFAEKSLSMLAPGGRLVLLLRLAFLASRKRVAFFRRHLPNEVWVISERTSFIGGTTDWSDHAFFVWKQGRAPKAFRGRHLHY